jgi:hypothetical protein
MCTRDSAHKAHGKRLAPTAKKKTHGPVSDHGDGSLTPCGTHVEINNRCQILSCQTTAGSHDAKACGWLTAVTSDKRMKPEKL